MSNSRMIIFALAAVFTAACGSSHEPNQEEARGADYAQGGKADSVYETRRDSAMTFEEFRESIYCEDEGPCIVQGDIPIWGEDALRDYYEERVELSDALTVMRTDAVDAIWTRTERFDLTYCVDDKFGERKDEVLEAVDASIAEWEALAHVDFRHLHEHDARCNNRNARVVFNISPTRDPFASYIARAFFPNYLERERREVLINLASHDRMLDNERISDAYTLTGVMRHEFGHVLGFRHEHIRDEADAFFCREDQEYRPITTYDAKSVMHYPHCNGEGDWGLELSETDELGASFFYPDFDDYVAGRCSTELDKDGRVLAECEPVVHQILELANTASFEVLDDWVRLDVRAAEEMVERRDEMPFNTLEELREIRYFEQVGIRKMYDYLYVDGRCPVEISEALVLNAQCRPIVNRILEFANEASLDELDHDARLDSRAAANIVTIRKERPFTDLSELWAVDYVKTRALSKLYAYLYDESF